MTHTLNEWWQAARIYAKPKVARMTLLGFSAGLPYLLFYVTLTARLYDIGINKSTIGFFAWVGLAYAFKILWAPFVDQIKLPVLYSWLGKRRSWIGLSQVCVALGLLGMALISPLHWMSAFVVCTLWTAFWAATQDIAVDAYRIEAVDVKYQGAMAATYVLGYRMAVLTAGAGALYLAEYFSWPQTYLNMALLMLLCFALMWRFIEEPEHQATPTKLMSWHERLQTAVLDPLRDVFIRHPNAVTILLLILCFRLSDISMGIMANPFYLETGFSKTDIATISKVYGIAMTLIGGFVGGIVVIRWGFYKTLLVAAVLTALTNLLFIQLSYSGADTTSLIWVISMDNTSAGFAMTAFIAYLSSLTNPLYTATQYALFSSLMNLSSKFLAGWSGQLVDAMGFSWFFAYSALLGLPAVLLLLYLLKQASNPTDPRTITDRE